MDLTITNSEGKRFDTPALAIAAIIAGRPLPADREPGLTAITHDCAMAAASQFMVLAGVTDKASYLQHRTALKAGLRLEADRIRKLKSQMRTVDGTHSSFWTLRQEIQEARQAFSELHDTRVLAKAWAGEERRRSLQEASAA